MIIYKIVVNFQHRTGLFIFYFHFFICRDKIFLNSVRYFLGNPYYIGVTERM